MKCYRIYFTHPCVLIFLSIGPLHMGHIVSLSEHVGHVTR